MNTGLLRHAVATVLTVYGIETGALFSFINCIEAVATVLTVYGIETLHQDRCISMTLMSVATVLTVYGIETYSNDKALEAQRLEELQQCLPFTVLKLSLLKVLNRIMDVLQQCLPFTVLKLRITTSRFRTMTNCVATVLTVYGIETLLIS